MAARPEAFNSVMIFIQMNGETVFVKGGQLLRERERTKTVRGDRFRGGTKNFVTGRPLFTIRKFLHPLGGG